MFPTTALIDGTCLLDAGFEYLIADRLLSQFVQLLHVAVQAVHLWCVQHMAGMVQPGHQLLDARQLLCQVLGALGVQRQLQGAAFLGNQVCKPACQKRLALALATALAFGSPGTRQQPT